MTNLTDRPNKFGSRNRIIKQIFILMDFIKRPYTVIDRIFNEERISGKADENWLRKVSDAFGASLVNEDALHSVPRLGPQSVPGTLVRVTGIVQDIFDPELYSQSLVEEETSNSSASSSSSSSLSLRATPFAFRDSLSPSLSIQSSANVTTSSYQSSHLETRVSIVLTPAPGESAWVKEFVERSTSVAPGYSSPGRQDALPSVSATSLSDEKKSTSIRKMKRVARQGESESDSDAKMDGESNNEGLEGGEALSFSSAHGVPVTSFAGVGASVIIPEGVGYNGGEVIVRTYGEDTTLKVGELVEIVGIFTHDPELTDFGVNDDDDMREEENQEEGAMAYSSSSDAIRGEMKIKRVASSTLVENGGIVASSSKTIESSSLTMSSSDVAATSEGITLGGGATSSFFPEDELARNPPASRVPRVHAILSRSLSSTYPLLQPPIGSIVSISANASPPSSPTSVLASSSSSSSSSVLSSTSPIEPFGFHDPCVPIALTWTSSSSSSPTKKSSGALFKEQEAAQMRALLVRAKREALQRNALNHIPSMVHSTGMSVLQLRSELLSFLTKVVCGDELAAEYLLLHTLSQVRLRKDVTVLDKFSLNLMGLPEATSPSSSSSSSLSSALSSMSTSTIASRGLGRGNTILEGSPAAQRIHGAISRLLPRTRFIPLRIDFLNSTRLAPRRDPITSRIEANVLQLAPGTYLIVDETVISSGRLDEVGLGGLQALQSISSSQSLPYDFIHFLTYFDVDTPTLILSHGRPLVKTDMSLPLSVSARDALHSESSSSSSSNPQAVAAQFDTPSLSSFFERARLYLACVRNLPYAMPDAVATAIENDLVSARATDASLKAEDLHLWLILARLSAISFGEQEITAQRWTSVVEMEKKRLAIVRSSAPHLGVSPTGGS